MSGAQYEATVCTVHAPFAVRDASRKRSGIRAAFGEQDVRGTNAATFS